ncbi:hypothetical protein MA16_Dca012148 [Dendrobium catenatum]|uniref:Transposase-associated domain-containing protein n=1 Tax=Dendrobium catenatum TaxID=906689 RepID=A0A2I0VF38_9ASPA|nr:hypothetical protein MA16_Dca012148 [Dendrobium catenatum]
MYNRLSQSRKTLTDEFINGVNFFIQQAKQLPIFISEGKFRCPCSKHKNLVILEPDDVTVDLYRRGFMPRYWYWTCHGEYEPQFDYQCGPSTSSNVAETENIRPNLEELVHDATGIYEELPNTEAQNFYDLLHAAQQPIWKGCTTHSELSVAVKMLSIKAEYNVARECFNQFIGLLKETNPTDNLIPTDLYRTKKLVSKLGLTYTKIDCCVNGCMLYFKEDIAETVCRHCNAPRFKPKSRNRRKQKDVSVSKMFYFPIIPRLQRLYASMRSAAHMRWHNDRIPQGRI